MSQYNLVSPISMYVFIYLHIHTCKLIPYITSKRNYIAKLKHKERKICGFSFLIVSSLQEKRNLKEILSINFTILNKKTS